MPDTGSPTADLARFVTIAEVPEPVLAAGAAALVDTLGVAIAARDEDVVRHARAWVAELQAAPVARIWGTECASAPSEAAFVNGIAAHALDFDDGMEGLHGHPSATLMPVALAVGEAVGSSGREVLAAYAIGIEVASAVGRVLGYGHYLKGWHKTSTVGVFAAATAAARLQGLDAQATCHAWGLAAAQMSGLLASFGTMAKSFQAGHAARCGVLAAGLARRGVTANARILDPGSGLLAAYAGSDGLALPAPGAHWALLSPGLSFKRWPCCYTSHRPLAGLLALMERHALHPAAVERVEVGFLPGADVALVSRAPQTGLEALVSLEYPLAAALLDGRVDRLAFTDAMVQRPEAQAAMRRILRRTRPSDRQHSWREGDVELVVVTREATYAERIVAIPGTAEAPMTPAETEAKFLACVVPALGDAAAAGLLTAARGAARLSCIRDLTALAVAT